MRLNFGLPSACDDDLETIIQPYLDLLQEAKTDYTFAMRTLSRVPGSVDSAVDDLAERSLNLTCDAEAWKDKMRLYFNSVYIPRLVSGNVAMQMNKVNPNFVLRNWVAQNIVDWAENSGTEWVDKTLKLFTAHAFDDHAPSGMEDAEKYTGPVPEWSEGLQCSCSL
ncbi:hypothetical protein IWW36_004456 [Coemansia brasiliensis]|uniref:Selenoprotein O n=1 Tax=Coemansia brasiliensis TaxID=2650707 RepID=A0A9W8I5X1_9FUNG|nr:hypothetical protein IWW36_004456 [Coemansia brasiliensis]